MPAEWTLTDAETKFRDIYKAARSGEPQYIQENGKVEAVVISINSELANEILPKEPQPELSFAEFLLTMPKGDWIDDQATKSLKLRDVEF